jgi:hypothetical protein
MAIGDLVVLERASEGARSRVRKHSTRMSSLDAGCSSQAG